MELAGSISTEGKAWRPDCNIWCHSLVLEVLTSTSPEALYGFPMTGRHILRTTALGTAPAVFKI